MSVGTKLRIKQIITFEGFSLTSLTFHKSSGEWRVGGREDTLTSGGCHQSWRKWDPSAGGRPRDRHILQEMQSDSYLGPSDRWEETHAASFWLNTRNTAAFLQTTAVCQECSTGVNSKSFKPLQMQLDPCWSFCFLQIYFRQTPLLSPALFLCQETQTDIGDRATSCPLLMFTSCSEG